MNNMLRHHEIQRCIDDVNQQVTDEHNRTYHFTACSIVPMCDVLSSTYFTGQCLIQSLLSFHFTCPYHTSAGITDLQTDQSSPTVL